MAKPQFPSQSTSQSNGSAPDGFVLTNPFTDAVPVELCPHCGKPIEDHDARHAELDAQIAAFAPGGEIFEQQLQALRFAEDEAREVIWGLPEREIRSWDELKDAHRTLGDAYDAEIERRDKLQPGYARSSNRV